MSLSCNCDYDGDYDWWYNPPEVTAPLTTKRARRCVSCKCKLPPGAEVGRFERWRTPNNDVEERIHGYDGEIHMADWYMCEDCTGLYWALADLGFCMTLNKTPMRALVKEYNQMRKDGHL